MQLLPAADVTLVGVDSSEGDTAWPGVGVVPFVASEFHPHLVVVTTDKFLTDACSVLYVSVVQC